MPISANYENYNKLNDEVNLFSQSIIETKLPAITTGKILAIAPMVNLSGAECLNGEIKYSGMLYLNVVYLDSENNITKTEKGIEFSHKIEDSRITPSDKASISLKIEKSDFKNSSDGASVSVIVGANADLFQNKQCSYFSSADGVVCKYKDISLPVNLACKANFNLEEEFDTSYVSDVILHGEEAVLNNVTIKSGEIIIEGEVNLNICAKSGDENRIISIERLTPFKAEIPCDEASEDMTAFAKVKIKTVNISVTLDEDKNRSHIIAEIILEGVCEAYGKENLVVCEDIFGTASEINYSKQQVKTTFAKLNEKIIERISGVSATSQPIDYSCSLETVCLQSAEVSGKASKDKAEFDGVISAKLIYYKDNEYKTCDLSVPFSFSANIDGLEPTDTLKTSAICVGFVARQKKEGEIEAEATLKVFVTAMQNSEESFICEVFEGVSYPVNQNALSVYFGEQGDEAWDVAKKLKQKVEEVMSYNPELTFPLTGEERIVVYRKAMVD